MKFKANDVKKEISKEFGIAVKDIRVKADIWSMRVEIKTRCKLQQIHAFLEKKYGEEGDYCRASGECLSTGYPIFSEISHDVRESILNDFKADSRKCANKKAYEELGLGVDVMNSIIEKEYYATSLVA